MVVLRTAAMGPWNGSANPRMLFLRTMAWSGPKLQTLTKNGSSGSTSATPRATATDLCRHGRMLGEMVTRPGVAQVAITQSSIRSLTRTWRHARTLAGWSSHDRSHLLASRVARIGVRPEVSGDVTNVVLPYNLLQACEDGFDMVIHKLGTENAWHR